MKKTGLRPTLVDLSIDELHYYPFIISMNRCDGSCNTVEDPSGRICVPNKMEDLNLKVLNMINGINQLKVIAKVSLDVNLMVGNVTRGKNGTMITVSVSVKNQQNITCVKKIMFGILVYELPSVTKTVRLVNT